MDARGQRALIRTTSHDRGEAREQVHYWRLGLKRCCPLMLGSDAPTAIGMTPQGDQAVVGFADGTLTRYQISDWDTAALTMRGGQEYLS